MGSSADTVVPASSVRPTVPCLLAAWPPGHVLGALGGSASPISEHPLAPREPWRPCRQPDAVPDQPPFREASVLRVNVFFLECRPQPGRLSQQWAANPRRLPAGGAT